MIASIWVAALADGDRPAPFTDSIGNQPKTLDCIATSHRNFALTEDEATLIIFDDWL